MPRARFLAPWHQAERIEALRGRKDLVEARELADLEGQPAIYHCLSRVVDQRFAFGTREKEKFVGFMRCYEEFSQVRVLAFCVMSNHFHILVEVPSPPPKRGRDWSDARFLEHLSCLYSQQALAEIRWQLEMFREQKAHAAAEEYRDRFFVRMWNLSEFMKGLKQSFSRWFNKVHERHGTLWEERFKSVLAEDGHATRVMAAYIDLNPVRAGMVSDPKDYRWSSYGEAMAGKQRAREGIGRLVLGGEGTWSEEVQAPDPSLRRCAGTGVLMSWRVTVRRYREVLYEPLEMDTTRASAMMSEAEALGGPVRQFSDGLVVGLQPFVERTFRLARDCFGPRRRDGARKMRGIETELRAMRDLQRASR